MFLRYCLCAIILSLCCGITLAQPIKRMKAEADELFNNKKFQKALDAYNTIQYSKPNDMTIRLKIGACSYFTNKTGQAKKYLHYILANDKSPDANVYFYLGRTYHAELNFKEAVKFYKLYLKNIKKSHTNRNWIKDEIRRCAIGLKIAAKNQKAIVENLGNNVNSRGDDFAPMLSPNFDDKIYFSSARRGNISDLRNEDGTRDEKLGNYRSDMFSSQVVNGEWTATATLNPTLNSINNEVILGFDEGGSILYYFSGPSLYSGEVLIDTFSTDGNPKMGYFSSPMSPEEGDGHPQFFNDTTLLFSSMRAGGYGGRDLYITTFTNGAWTSAKNLGPVINSEYDETTPFLSVDGRTLYFSSNNLNSIGGFDVFQSTFDDIAERWSVPENMGLPINSAANDTYFKLSRDGYKGYLSSNRIESQGQRDIYVAYFKTQNREQLVNSTPTIFSEVRAYKSKKPNNVSVAMQTPNSGEGTISTISAPQFSEEEITSYEFTPLFYNKDDAVLSYRNTTMLNKVARLLIEYPQLRLVLTSNSEGGAPANFDMYFSIKKAEEASDYLIENGVNPRNITVKGCGANYPIAKIESEKSGFKVQAKRLNRRIDIDILNTTGLPIRINMEYPVVNNQIKDQAAAAYKTDIQGLSYKVQIASIKQMYNGNILTQYDDPMVESDGSNAYYRYSVGLYQTFSDANQLRSNLIRQGVTDAFVVPYVNGLRVNRDDSKIYSAAYPDLLNFIEKTD